MQAHCDRCCDAQIMHCPTAHFTCVRGGILKQAESRVPVSELCREHGMSNASFYEWRAKFSGMDESLIGEMKGLAEQNRPLKKM